MQRLLFALVVVALLGLCASEALSPPCPSGRFGPIIIIDPAPMVGPVLVIEP